MLDSAAASTVDMITLALLDFSGVFDTINYAILLEELQGLGMRGIVLQWFSFLHGWFWAVLAGEEGSSP